MYWKSASKYSIQAVTISMYMLINSSKPHKIIKEIKILFCVFTLYIQKNQLIIYNVIKFPVLQYKKDKMKLGIILWKFMEL